MASDAQPNAAREGHGGHEDGDASDADLSPSYHSRGSSAVSVSTEVDSDDDELITVYVSLMRGRLLDVNLHGDRTFGAVTNEVFKVCPEIPRGEVKYILAEASKGHTDRFTDYDDYDTILKAAAKTGWLQVACAICRNGCVRRNENFIYIYIYV